MGLPYCSGGLPPAIQDFNLTAKLHVLDSTISRRRDMRYQDLWAKSEPYHPLWCHLLDVAAVGRALLPRFGPLAPLPENWILYLLALHDIGKADVDFQTKDEECAKVLREKGWDLPALQIATHFRHEP